MHVTNCSDAEEDLIETDFLICCVVRSEYSGGVLKNTTLVSAVAIFVFPSLVIFLLETLTYAYDKWYAGDERIREDSYLEHVITSVVSHCNGDIRYK